jgi:transposase
MELFIDMKLYLIHVFKWFKRYREECEDIQDSPRRGQPSTTQNVEAVAELNVLVARDPQMP